MKFFSSRFLCTCSLSLLGFNSAFSQQSYGDTNPKAAFQNALRLYQSKAYSVAQKTFENLSIEAPKYSSLHSEASYYEAMCAVFLNQKNAEEKIKLFITENPTSIQKNNAFWNVGNYYFSLNNAARSLKWFQKVAPETLSKEQKNELNFKMGYALLSTKNYELAQKRFSSLRNNPKYGNDASYYYGFIAYTLEDYDTAEASFKKLENNNSYAASVSYHLLDIYFKSGEFDRCIALGNQLLLTVKSREQSMISKIVGESYFHLKKYKEAIPFLKAYKGERRKWNHNDYYQLGYAYYKQNDFKNAINNFNKIIGSQNEVSQNAYYHLGESYLNVLKKAEALSAFKAASEMDFDLQIKEDAALNYAKLSYEEGNPFQSVADILQNFLKAYPTSTSYQEINNLIVNSFIQQQDYVGALQYLSKNKSKENTTLEFEVALYRGIQLYQTNQIEEALPFFTQARQSKNQQIGFKARYWEAEALYQLEKYDASLANFLQLKKILKWNSDPEFSEINYAIGYTYFKLQKYEQAIPYFENISKKEDLPKEIVEDALIRLGDSYYATKAYQKAIISYQKLIDRSGIGADYAQYQIGMSYGFTDKNDAKINALQKVVNQYEVSDLKDDALFQLGNTYTKLKNNRAAEQAFDQLLEKYPNSTFTPKVLVRQGLLYYNEGENEDALNTFKQIARLYPNSSEAFEAVSNARNVYIDLGNIEEYVNWVKELKFINITNSEVDNTTFAAAEKKYIASTNLEDIVASLVDYCTKFPEGLHILKANFYLGKTYFNQKLYPEAIAPYSRVLEEGQNEYSEAALNELSQIYLFDEAFQKALPLLKRLEREANSPTNILYAQSNLMQGYYKMQAYELAIAYAKKILLREKLDTLLENDAKVIIARSAFHTNDPTTAEAFYTEVEKNATGELKAESLYFNAFFKNKKAAYESSNEIVQKLIANYSSYKYWGVKSYVLMAKNYYGLQDVYQATYVLENVIQNFKEFEDIVKEAQIALETIKATEAKRGSSILPEKNKN
ncbi:tetratricopeptide repeat protein [Polaribacter sp. HL-MS24]|uniref:tetratricopeptide repeat protein n=1 Tax=Polaribacter sp. HL-MS24 TaxID=3077735 RepID=UPI0029351D17|nr:tetratricopeptide repeat protein [Polaribacter sp. HL-MS24]WOC40808.1 tetratricopeptide repeat protein [Polaribacter sp. HL-MS24]